MFHYKGINLTSSGKGNERSRKLERAADQALLVEKQILRPGDGLWGVGGHVDK